MSKYLSVADISDRILDLIVAAEQSYTQDDFAKMLDVTQPTISNRLKSGQKSSWRMEDVASLLVRCPSFRTAFFALFDHTEQERVDPPETIAMSNVKIAGDLISEICQSMLDGVVDNRDNIDGLIIKSAESIAHMSIYRSSLIKRRNELQSEIQFGVPA